MTQIPFPFHRRQDVLRDIAATFVREGFDAGNKRAEAWGWTLIVHSTDAGMDADRIAADLDAFIAAWRAFTIPRLAKAPHVGGNAA